MPKEVIRIDELLTKGAESLARMTGHGDIWDGGLGHILGRVLDASDISRRPISVDQARRRVGLTDQNIETARAVANLGRRMVGKR